VQIGERADALFDVVDATTVTPNTFDIIAGVADPSLAIKLRLVGTLSSKALGLSGSGDETAGLSRFFTLITDNDVKGVLEPLSYTVSGQLLNRTTACNLHLESYGSGAQLTYTGAELSRLIRSDETENIELRNISIDCANLIANPIDLRKTSALGGRCIIKDVDVSNVKQTTVTTSAIGIYVQGEYEFVDVAGCDVTNVSRVDTSLSCIGISLNDMTGRVSVKNNGVSGVSTPGSSDADGISVLSKDVATITTPLKGVVEIANNRIEDCEGRFVKVQMSHSEIHNNRLGLSSGFTTITDWRGIDVQSNNGSIHDNDYVIASGVTFGADATLATLQNIRNDGNNKVARMYNNRVSLGSPINSLAVLISEYGTNSFIIEGNDVTGSDFTDMVRFTENNLANTTKINIHIRNNRVDGVTTYVFDPTSDIDFSNKLFLEITDNIDYGDNQADIVNQAKTVFSANSNFIIGRNVGMHERVNWAFDMDLLPAGSSFKTGGQTVTNRGTGITTFFKVETSSEVQWNISFDSTKYTVRNKDAADPPAWQAWKTVTVT
jgi:hypothetical protein